MFDRFFALLGRLLARGYRLTLVIWVALMLVAAPFALKLNKTLGDNTVSLKGSEWYNASQQIKHAFPQAGAQDVVLALQAEDVRSDDAFAFYQRLESYLQGLKDERVIVRYSTPLDLYRGALSAYLKGVHDQLWPGYAQVKSATERFDGLRAQVAAAAGGRLPAAVVEQMARQQVLAGTPLPQRAGTLALFDLGPKPSSETLISFVVDQARQQTAGVTTKQADLWQRALKLGEHPDQAAYDKAAREEMGHLSLGQFPVAIPDNVQNLLISEDGTLALTSLTYRLDDKENTYRIRRELPPLVPSGMKTYLTGTAPLYVDLYDGAQSQTTVMDIGAVAAIVVILSFFFRSPLPMVLTLLQVGISLVVGRGALYFLAEDAHVYLSPATLTLMSFVMLGAGVDYSMILSERYQQERRLGRDKFQAVSIAAARAGESVFFSGATVLVSFGTLLTSRMEWLGAMGYGGVVGVLTVLIAALTLTPALLMLLGDRFFWPARPMTETELTSSGFYNYLKRSIGFTLKRPVVVTLLFLIPLLPSLWAVRQYNPETSPVALSGNTESKLGLQLMDEKFGAGRMAPTEVLVTAPASWWADDELSDAGKAAVSSLHVVLTGVPVVDAVHDTLAPLGELLKPDALAQLPAETRQQLLSPKERLVRFQVLQKHDPFTPAGKDDLAAIKQITEQALKGSGATVLVGGGAQFDTDYKGTIFADFFHLVPIIAIGIFVLLSLLLRSVITPIRLIITILMGNLWAIALLVVIFQHWRHVAVTADVPLFLVVLMMGLGMDYEIFLVTRVREHVMDGADDATAVRDAVLQTGRVINGAGLVMACTLASLLLSPTLMLQSYGLALGFAVLVDATVMRMYLVPATMLLLKRANWWFPFLGTPKVKRRHEQAGEKAIGL